jgi:hypothetical protein
MDTALELKQKYDSGEITDYIQAVDLLENSNTLKELLTDFEFETLNILNRLIVISEIPFTYHLPKVKEWVESLVEKSFCGDGFSFSGKSDDILSCYNSMITSTLIRMHYPDKNVIEAGIDWILKYQNFCRGEENTWSGSRIQKYGGCMKSTPCYIGVVKAAIALSDFKKMKNYQVNSLLEEKLKEGLGYILEHELYKQKSNGQPITKDILKLTYPISYKTNIIEILRLLKANNFNEDPRCESAREYLLAKKNKNGYWKKNSSYIPKGWISLDKTKEPGYWLSHEIEKILSSSCC